MHKAIFSAVLIFLSTGIAMTVKADDKFTDMHIRQPSTSDGKKLPKLQLEQGGC